MQEGQSVTLNADYRDLKAGATGTVKFVHENGDVTVVFGKGHYVVASNQVK